MRSLLAHHLVHHRDKLDGVGVHPGLRSIGRLHTAIRPTTMTAMSAVPLYDPASVDAAHELRYSWTGWPSSGCFTAPIAELLATVQGAWEDDGMKLLEQRCAPDVVQLLFSARPNLSPQLIAARAKGRLDHAARKTGHTLDFSRKLAVRSIGENTRRDVEAYIERQVRKERFADARFEAAMEQFTVQNPDVDLSVPTETARGRYWYNLHMVLVVEGRTRVADLRVLAQLRDAVTKIAAKKGHLVSRLSVMPDHLHAALRPTPEESPNDVVYTYQNNLAYMLRMGRMWTDGFYVGTFGEYSMQAVRNSVSRGGD